MPDLVRWMLSPDPWKDAPRFTAKRVRRHSVAVYKLIEKHIPEPEFLMQPCGRIYFVLSAINWSAVSPEQARLFESFIYIADISDKANDMNSMAARGQAIFAAAMTSDVAQGASAERMFYSVEAKKMGGQETPSKEDSSLLVKRNCHYPSAIQRWKENRAAILIIHFEAPDVSAQEAKTFLRGYIHMTEFTFLTFQQLCTRMLEDANKPMQKPAGMMPSGQAKQIANDKALTQEWVHAIDSELQEMNRDKRMGYMLDCFARWLASRDDIDFATCSAVSRQMVSRAIALMPEESLQQVIEVTMDTEVFKLLVNASIKPDGSGAMTRQTAAILVRALLRRQQFYGGSDPRMVVQGWCAANLPKPAGGPLSAPRPATEVAHQKFEPGPHEGVPEHWIHAIDEIERMPEDVGFQMGSRASLGRLPLRRQRPAGNP